MPDGWHTGVAFGAGRTSTTAPTYCCAESHPEGGGVLYLRPTTRTAAAEQSRQRRFHSGAVDLGGAMERVWPLRKANFLAAFVAAVGFSLAVPSVAEAATCTFSRGTTTCTETTTTQRTTGGRICLLEEDEFGNALVGRRVDTYQDTTTTTTTYKGRNTNRPPHTTETQTQSVLISSECVE
jgi:hypothetical protein